MKKTSYIIFKPHKKHCAKDLRATLNGNIIDIVHSTKCLGLIDEHFTWKYHTNQGRIQDFEMGGENVKKIKKSNIILIFEG